MQCMDVLLAPLAKVQTDEHRARLARHPETAAGR